MRASDESRSISSVRRLRLFTPTISRAGVEGLVQLVGVVHFDEHVEARGAAPAHRSEPSACGDSAATISSTASAPAARASSS